MRVVLSMALVLTVLVLPATAAAAYKCVGPDGQVNFTDQPCAAEQTSESITIEKKEKPAYTYEPSCSSYDVAEKIRIGMAASEAMDVCGYPDEVNRTQTTYGVNEQWVYGRFPRSSYVYVENDVVTAIQD